MKARIYPDPDPSDDGIVWIEEFVVVEGTEEKIVADDGEARDHPEVFLTPARRDAVLQRMGYQRTGPWGVEDEDGCCEAPVEPART